MRKLLAPMALSMLLAGSLATAAGKSETTIPEIKSGQAQIVFLRKTTVNALVGIIVYDVTSGEPKALGKLTNNRKLIVDVQPGEHLFMTGNLCMQDFMPVTVAADKRYYVVVNAFWPALFSMRPVRHEGSEFLYKSPKVEEMVAETKLAKPFDEAKDGDKKEKVLECHKVSWTKWQEKNAEQRAVLTMRAEDSVN